MISRVSIEKLATPVRVKTRVSDFSWNEATDEIWNYVKAKVLSAKKYKKHGNNEEKIRAKWEREHGGTSNVYRKAIKDLVEDQIDDRFLVLMYSNVEPSTVENNFWDVTIVGYLEPKCVLSVSDEEVGIEKLLGLEGMPKLADINKAIEDVAADQEKQLRTKQDGTLISDDEVLAATSAPNISTFRAKMKSAASDMVIGNAKRAIVATVVEWMRDKCEIEPVPDEFITNVVNNSKEWSSIKFDDAVYSVRRAVVENMICGKICAVHCIKDGNAAMLSEIIYRKIVSNGA